ncbi:MAG: hypothetical protein R3B40_28775 [Polyangiales bacterium]
MSGWKIIEWSQERARGRVESGAGVLDFDAAIADVDDFRVGESIELELVRDGATYRVLRIWPVAMRYRPPGDFGSADRLDSAHLEAFRAACRTLGGGDAERIEQAYVRLSFDDDGGSEAILVGDSPAYSTSPHEVRLHGLSYAEFSLALECCDVRLSDARERAYLASRTDLTSDHIALTLTWGRRCGFLVGRALR